MRRLILIVVVILFCGGAMAADPTILVTANQRYPWNGLVDVAFTITGDSGTKYDTSFLARDVVVGTNLTMKTLYKSDGSAAALTNQLAVGSYKWVWNAAADLPSGFVGERVVITGNVNAPLGGVQLWANGPYWAECNVGASKPESYGYYFNWGGTVGYRYLGENSWKSSDGSTYSSFYDGDCQTDSKSDASLRSMGYINSANNLVASHDAATVYLGEPWRMPTKDEVSALVNNCDFKWATQNGVYGRLVTGRGGYSTKSIFLPAAGYGDGVLRYSAGSQCSYWSATSSASGGCYWYAWCFYSLGNETACTDSHRHHGRTVRPVRDSAQ